MITVATLFVFAGLFTLGWLIAGTWRNWRRSHLQD